MRAYIGGSVVPIFFLTLIGVNLCAGAESSDTARILQAFKDSYQWTQQVSMGVESTESGAEKPERASKRSFRVFQDGHDRIHVAGELAHLHRDTGKPFPQEDWPDGPFQMLYDGQEKEGLFFQSRRMTDQPGEQTVEVYQDGASRLEICRAQKENGGPVLGYMFPFTKKCLPDLFSAESTTVREEMLDGRSCLVLESETPEGHVTAWVSPEEGYALRKCTLIKEAGKHYGYSGKIFEHVNPIFGTPLVDKRMVYEITNVRLQESGGMFLPSEMNCTYTEEFEGGKKYQSTIDYLVTDVEVNPDFQAMNAFKLSIPEGSTVDYYLKNGERMTGFSWIDGRIAADVDASGVAAIERTVLAMKKDDEVKVPGAARGINDVESHTQTGSSKKETGRIYALMLAVGSALLIAAIILRHRAKGS